MENQQQKDHDLLIKISTVLDGLVNDVKDIKTNTVGRIEDLEVSRATKDELKNVSDKVENIEKKQVSNDTYLKLAVALGALILSVLVWHLTGYKI